MSEEKFSQLFERLKAGEDVQADLKALTHAEMIQLKRWIAARKEGNELKLWQIQRQKRALGQE